MKSEPEFLALSPGRSGSRYRTKCLGAIGIPTQHEFTRSINGRAPQWKPVEDSVGEVSAHLVVHARLWPDAQIWHFSRHPQPFVTSMKNFKFFDFNLPDIHPYRRRSENYVVDAYRYWVDWNARILALPNRTTFRIEDLSDELLSMLAGTIDRDPTHEIDPQWKENQEFEPLLDEVRDEVEDMMETLGYVELPAHA
jgi:hypothetical protein